MYTLGRGLQLLGMSLVLVGIFLAEGAHSGGNAMAAEMGMLALGGAVFLVGYGLVRRAGPD